MLSRFALVALGDAASYKKVGIEHPDRLSDVDLAQQVVATGITSEDGVRDAVDCLIEELICEVVA